jgi:hypothetical protein
VKEMLGGYGRGWRHRRMYYATGVPGYGRGRCAWRCPPQVAPELVYPGPGAGSWPGHEPAAGAMDEEELRMLEEEEEMLQQDLEDLREAIEGLRMKKEKEVNK